MHKPDVTRAKPSVIQPATRCSAAQRRWSAASRRTRQWDWRNCLKLKWRPPGRFAGSEPAEDGGQRLFQVKPGDEPRNTSADSHRFPFRIPAASGWHVPDAVTTPLATAAIHRRKRDPGRGSLEKPYARHNRGAELSIPPAIWLRKTADPSQPSEKGWTLLFSPVGASRESVGPLDFSTTHQWPRL
ncbi:hypothetical protein MAPG_11281 [Magnaporthiopsis poae ATCC 64411]|uniref:Uncharacterized protein n=1 Tax=Magnaporthiopsis poae (strain ATCC 64411 / 73-15) TaxID=644358 RepID=A0A0C4EEV0_MAGP6|nr:hypothetical protein MAPG_11281 [Magnaporthiopsis poae ATCC 64411]